MRNYRNSAPGTFTSTGKTTADHVDIQQEVDVTKGLGKRILCPSARSVGFYQGQNRVTRGFLDIAAKGGHLKPSSVFLGQMQLRRTTQMFDPRSISLVYQRGSDAYRICPKVIRRDDSKSDISLFVFLPLNLIGRN